MISNLRYESGHLVNPEWVAGMTHPMILKIGCQDDSFYDPQNGRKDD